MQPILLDFQLFGVSLLLIIIIVGYREFEYHSICQVNRKGRKQHANQGLKGVHDRFTFQSTKIFIFGIYNFF